MRTVIAGLFVASMLAAGTANAQYAPFNDAGVTMGHWHLISKDVEANKKTVRRPWAASCTMANATLMMFPGVDINLTLGNEKGDGGTRGSVVNHVGFIVDNVQERVAAVEGRGRGVLPGNNGRLDQAFVVTPDGVRIEILEDKTQGGADPARAHPPVAAGGRSPQGAGAWYAKTFGGKAGTRNNAPIVDMPGVADPLRHGGHQAGADQGPRPRPHRLRREGPRRLCAKSSKPRASSSTSRRAPVRRRQCASPTSPIPWGTRIEIVQRAPDPATR